MLSRRTLLGAATGAIAGGVTQIGDAAGTNLLVEGHELSFGDLKLRCAIGRGGLRRDKHEGDGATPVGLFPLRRVFYRADRLPAIESGLPVEPLQRTDGWCDAPGDAHYNERVTLPYAGHHEELWRDDHVYDVIIVIGYNDAPVVSGKGSAIFLHLARPDFSPTDGCVAMEQAALLEIARQSGPATLIDIRPA